MCHYLKSHTGQCCTSNASAGHNGGDSISVCICAFVVAFFKVAVVSFKHRLGASAAVLALALACEHCLGASAAAMATPACNLPCGGSSHEHTLLDRSSPRHSPHHQSPRNRHSPRRRRAFTVPLHSWAFANVVLHLLLPQHTGWVCLGLKHTSWQKLMRIGHVQTM